jgi:hypothetical protein
MRATLGSPAEYRDFARQCLQWAARATREDHKNMMLQMANHWLQVAQDIEGAADRRAIPNTPVPGPSQKN